MSGACRLFGVSEMLASLSVSNRVTAVLLYVCRLSGTDR